MSKIRREIRKFQIRMITDYKKVYRKSQLKGIFPKKEYKQMCQRAKLHAEDLAEYSLYKTGYIKELYNE